MQPNNAPYGPSTETVQPMRVRVRAVEHDHTDGAVAVDGRSRSRLMPLLRRGHHRAIVVLVLRVPSVRILRHVRRLSGKPELGLHIVYQHPPASPFMDLQVGQ